MLSNGSDCAAEFDCSGSDLSSSEERFGISRKAGAVSSNKDEPEGSSSSNSSRVGEGAGWARLSLELVCATEAERVVRSVSGATYLFRFLFGKSGTGFTLFWLEESVGWLTDDAFPFPFLLGRLLCLQLEDMKLLFGFLL